MKTLPEWIKEIETKRLEDEQEEAEEHYLVLWLDTMLGITSTSMSNKVYQK